VGSTGNERQVTNVAAGTQSTDAVNKAQLDSGVATANSYTDSRFSAMADTFDTYKGEIDDRFRRQDRRLDRQGAMNAAMLNMATSAAGIRTENRVGVGVGFQSGESALSIGYQRALSDRATVTLGGAFSGDDKSVGVGAGFGW
jgi:autotransporter adhesin